MPSMSRVALSVFICALNSRPDSSLFANGMQLSSRLSILKAENVDEGAAYCGDQALRDGPSGGRADCRKRCHTLPDCLFFTYWKTNVTHRCRLTETCDIVWTDPGQVIEVYKKVVEDDEDAADSPPDTPATITAAQVPATVPEEAAGSPSNVPNTSTTSEVPATVPEEAAGSPSNVPNTSTTSEVPKAAAGSPPSVPSTSTIAKDYCWKYNNMRLQQGSVVFSNLGGLGPNVSFAAKSIFFADVFPNSVKVTDLQITADEDDVAYDPVDVNLNGESNKFGVVNVNMGSQVILKFKLINRKTGAAENPIQRLAITIFDIDRGDDGAGQQTVIAPGISDYSLSNDTILIAEDVDGSTQFSPSAAHTGLSKSQQTVLDPLGLTAPQKSHSVTLMYMNTNEFTLIFKTSPGSGSSNFRFAGASNLVCTEKAPCTEMACPAGKTLGPYADQDFCVTGKCSPDRPADVETCCVPVVPETCNISQQFAFNDLVHSNIVGLGPNISSSQSVLLENVLPRSGDDVFMEVTTSTENYTGTPTVSRGLLLIDVPGSSTQKDVEVTVAFKNRDGTAHFLKQPYHFSFLGLNAQETATMTPKPINISFGNQVSVSELANSVSIKGRPSAEDYDLVHSREFNTFNYMHMDQEQGAMFASALMRPSESFKLTLRYEGTKTGTFVMGGTTSRVCPERASCTTLVCPVGFTPRRNVEGILCKESHCRASDTTTCCRPVGVPACAPEKALMFTGPVLHSNLGGLGPDAGDESIVLPDVFPHSGSQIDMTVTALSNYTGGNVSLNGIDEAAFAVNVAIGTSVSLRVRFDNRNGSAFNIGPFHLSVLDLDQQKNGGGQETCSVNSISNFTLGPHAQVAHTVEGNMHKFQSTIYGAGGDQFTNPYHLTVPEMEKSATMLMDLPDNEFNVTLETSEGFGTGRNFFFTGSTNRVCPEPSLCSDYVCPFGYENKTEAAFKPCAEQVCSSVDILTCCKIARDPDGLCDANSALTIDKSRLRYSNLGSVGPDFSAMDKGMLIANVFSELVDNETSDANATDLLITITGPAGVSYAPTNFANNTVLDSELGQIVVPPNTTIQITFSYYDRGSGALSDGLGPYWMTAYLPQGNPDFKVTAHAALKFKAGPATTTHQDGRTFWNTVPIGGELLHPLVANSQGQRAAVSMLMDGSSQTNFVLENLGNASAQFVFAGQSSLVCPTRANCSEFTCPLGFAANAAGALCAGPTCEDVDTTTCCTEHLYDPLCEDDSMVVFGRNSLLWSNIAGKGPDSGEPGMRIGSVLPTKLHRSPVDLHIDAVDYAQYVAINVSKNRLVSQLGQINQAPGTSADFIFTFVDRETGEPVKVDDFFFSFFALNQEKGGGGSEAVQILSPVLDDYKLSSDTAVQAEQDTTIFLSTAYGNERDADGMHPLSLDAGEARKAVTVRIPSTSNFTVRFRTGHSTTGRNVIFAGASSLVCPHRASCTEMQCPTNFMQRSDADYLACKTATCNDDDTDTCCVPIQDPCSSDKIFRFTQGNLLSSNLGGQGPDFAADAGMLFSDVLPEYNETIDMLVSVQSPMRPYKPYDTLRNGVNGGIGRISLEQGSGLELFIDFMKRSNTSEAPDLGPIYLSFVLQAGDALQVSDAEAVGYRLTPASKVRHDDSRPGLFVLPDDHTVQGAPANTMTLAETLQHRTLTLLYDKGQKIALQLNQKKGGTGGREFFFGGASNFVCGERDTCKTAVCPIGYKAKPQASFQVCREQQCSDDDMALCCTPEETTPCDLEHIFDLSQASVNYSNLGGEGPDLDEPKAVLYSNVFPYSGTIVNAKLESTCSSFNSQDPYHNGILGNVGTINVATGSKFKGRLLFVDDAGSPLTINSFWFSFFGLNCQPNGGGQQKFKMTSHFLDTRRSDVSVLSTDPSGWYWAPTSSQNPKLQSVLPMHLTEDDLARTASYLMPATDRVEFEFEISAGESVGHNFMFAGASSMVCGQRDTCAAFQCPRGYMHKPNADKVFCKDPSLKCQDDDRESCCIKLPSEPCNLANAMVLHVDSLVYNNLDGQGPDKAGPVGIKFADVFPYRGGPKVDLLVNVASGTYTPGHVMRNGFSDRTEFYFDFNIGAGTTVDLEFVLMSEGNYFKPPTDYMISWVDIDQQENGYGVESVKPLSRILRYDLANESTVLAISDSDDPTQTMFTSSDYGKFLDDPTNPQELTDFQLKRSVSMLLPAGEPRFRIQLGVSPLAEGDGETEGAGRNILFAGTSSIACPAHPTCDSYVKDYASCPTGTRLIEAPWRSFCREGPMCTAMDTATCCMVSEEEA